VSVRLFGRLAPVVLLWCGIWAATAGAHGMVARTSQIPTPTPAPTPVMPACPPGYVGYAPGHCILPPCDLQAAVPPTVPLRTGARRTPQGISVRLLPIPTTGTLESTIGPGWVAWITNPWVEQGAHRSQPYRVYVSGLAHFHPRLVASSCQTLEDVHVADGRLIWGEVVLLKPFPRTTERIWAMNLATGRRWVVNRDVFPARLVTDAGPVSADGDTLTWTRNFDDATGRHWVDRMEFVSYRLPNGPLRVVLPPLTPSYQTGVASVILGRYAPVRAGPYLVWIQAWTDETNLIMMKDLRTGHVRRLDRGILFQSLAAHGNAAVVNQQVRLCDPCRGIVVRYDLATGKRSVVSNGGLGVFDYPVTLAGSIAAWGVQRIQKGDEQDSVNARDLRTGRFYALASGGIPGNEPGTVLSPPGEGFGSHVIWAETVDDTAGWSTQSYLALARVP
jgi:hypothetical protein